MEKYYSNVFIISSYSSCSSHTEVSPVEVPELGRISFYPQQHQELSGFCCIPNFSITKNKQTTLRKCLWLFSSSGHPFRGAQAIKQSLSIFSIWQFCHPRIFLHNNLKESSLSFGWSWLLQHPRVSSWGFQGFYGIIGMFTSITDPLGQLDIGTVVCSYGFYIFLLIFWYIQTPAFKEIVFFSLRVYIALVHPRGLWRESALN